MYVGGADNISVPRGSRVASAALKTQHNFCSLSSPRVNWKDDYFIEELLYSKEDSLVNAKDIEMQVQTLNSDLNSKEMCNIEQKHDGIAPDKSRSTVEHESDQKVENPLCQNSIHSPLDGNHLLDIDLDFFSTHNPFKLHHLEVVELANFTHHRPLLLGCSAIHCINQGVTNLLPEGT